MSNDKGQKLARLLDSIANEKDAKRQMMRGYNDNIKRLEAEAIALAKDIQDDGQHA